MEVIIRNNATLNQMAIVLNFASGVFFLLDFTEPAIIRIIAASIMVTCSMPKNLISRWWTASLKCAKK
jgi:hypothetical protein